MQLIFIFLFVLALFAKYLILFFRITGIRHLTWLRRGTRAALEEKDPRAWVSARYAADHDSVVEDGSPLDWSEATAAYPEIALVVPARVQHEEVVFPFDIWKDLRTCGSVQ